ncbi:hypothetical protein SAMN05443245_7601 [Paraburkholderia fungorum]|uniref:Uncharacterized protein n=1 Tax=Paraburkholderia fungorum TaxID=134537 RepID=A0A1H1JYP9_9BURK|nr:hypothetical protein SAMN05443245_7601 [Paraburkholderia fungorum]
MRAAGAVASGRRSNRSTPGSRRPGRGAAMDGSRRKSVAARGRRDVVHGHPQYTALSHISRSCRTSRLCRSVMPPSPIRLATLELEASGSLAQFSMPSGQPWRLPGAPKWTIRSRSCRVASGTSDDVAPVMSGRISQGSSPTRSSNCAEKILRHIGASVVILVRMIVTCDHGRPRIALATSFRISNHQLLLAPAADSWNCPLGMGSGMRKWRGTKRGTWNDRVR